MSHSSLYPHCPAQILAHRRNLINVCGINKILNKWSPFLYESMVHEAIILGLDIYKAHSTNEQTGCLAHFITIPLTLLLENTGSRASVRVQYFQLLMTSDLFRMLPSSSRVYVLAMETGRMRTLSRNSLKETFEQQSSVGSESL